jgi:hypothetical protein
MGDEKGGGSDHLVVPRILSNRRRGVHPWGRTTQSGAVMICTCSNLSFGVGVFKRLVGTAAAFLSGHALGIVGERVE